MTYSTKRGREIMSRRTAGHLSSYQVGGLSVLEAGRQEIADSLSKANAESICHAVNSHAEMCDLIDAQAEEIASLKAHNKSLQRKLDNARLRVSALESFK